VPVGAVLAGVGEDADALAAAAVEAVAAGAALVKVKIAPGRDVDVLRAVAEAVPRTPVAADANGSYPDAEAVVALERALGAVRLAYLEQPLAPTTTPDDWARLRAALSVPVALDESLTSLDAVATALRAGAVDVVSVKPARLGGVAPAAAAVALCRDAGADAFVGGMFELGVGRAAAAAVAALDGCTLPTDLGPSARYVETDVTDPVVVDDDGLLLVPQGPGCGREPLVDRLAEVTVDEVLLTA
jgi:O-succinylbenzoate synthase